MAVEWDLEDEEEEQSSTGSGTQIAGAPAVMSGSEQPSDQPGSSSGSYTNLQKYIEANKGRDFGGDVANKINTETQEGLNQLNQRENEFKTSVDQGSVNFDDDLKVKITESPQSLSQEEKDRAQNIRMGAYKGPEDFGGGVDDPYAQLRQYFGGLEQTKGAIQSDGGQKALLSKYYDRPTYTQGEKSLDSYILGSQFKPVQDAKNSLGSAIDTYSQKTGELNKYASNAKEKSKASTSDYYSLLGLDSSGTAKQRGDASPGLIQSALQKIDNQANKRRSDLNTQLSQARAVGRDLSSSGSGIFQNLGGVDRTYGVDPNRYLTGTPEANLNASSTATQDDLARMQALSELAGLPQTYLDPSLVGTQDDEALMNFDLNKFLEAVNASKGTYESMLRNPVSYMGGVNEIRGGLDDVLAQGAPIYNEKLATYNTYPEAQRNWQGSNPLYLKQNFIDPYEALLKQKEDLRKQYGYYDLVRR